MRFNSSILFSTGILFSFIVSLYAGNPAKISWSHSQQIVLNTSLTGATVQGDLKDLAVLIKLDNQSGFDFKKNKQNLAKNINFRTSDGTCLTYYIQKWDTSEKIGEIWIIVPRVYGNNSTQSITMSRGKNKDAITDQKMKDEIAEKEAHQAEIATTLQSGDSLFKSSYEIYGVWTSNEENGFSIVK